VAIKPALTIHKNDKEGLQLEIAGVLVTIRPNEFHGIHGSVAVREKKTEDMKVFLFHGEGPGKSFPMQIHEDKL
jgi:hypothetical protein